jgi:hypothetical protein
MGYQPKPGSVAYRTVAWLEQQPVGADFLISQLAERVDAPAHSLQAHLQQAIDAGIILKRPPKGQDRPYFFSLNPLQHPEYREPASNGTPVARPVKTNSTVADAPPSAPSEAAPARPPSKGTATPKDGRSPPESSLRCALWSDGSLEILRTAEQREPIVLTREETRQLVQYLDAISLEGIA